MCSTQVVFHVMPKLAFKLLLPKDIPIKVRFPCPRQSAKSLHDQVLCGTGPLQAHPRPACSTGSAQKQACCGCPHPLQADIVATVVRDHAEPMDSPGRIQSVRGRWCEEGPGVLRLSKRYPTSDGALERLLLPSGLAFRGRCQNLQPTRLRACLCRHNLPILPWPLRSLIALAMGEPLRGTGALSLDRSCDNDAWLGAHDEETCV